MCVCVCVLIRGLGQKINMFIFLKAIAPSVLGDDSRYDTGAIDRKSLSDTAWRLWWEGDSKEERDICLPDDGGMR